jgi:hypothetical protein
MGTRTIVQLEDDLMGGQAAETVTFGIDGKSFQLDLNKSNAAALRQLLAPYVAAGRAQRARHTQRKTSGTVAGEVGPATIRAWAIANGYAVSSRGRVSQELRAAYKASGAA